MANRPTKRERREMAKRQKLEAQRNAVRRRRRRTFQSVVIFVVIGALIGLGIWWGGKASREKAAKAKAAAAALEKTINTNAAAAGCSNVQTFADQGHEHIASGQKAKYNSTPGTSGPHYSGQLPGGPGYTGVIPAPVPDEVAVHNLEHGHVGIEYDPAKLPADLKTALEKFTNTDNQWVFMAPRSPSPSPLVFTAWTKMVTCQSPKDDPAAITKVAQAFHDAYKANKITTETVPGTPIPG